MEEWRDIAGYEGFCQVSSLGRVRSLDRAVSTTGAVPIRQCRGKLLSPYDNGKGYFNVGLSRNGSSKTHRVCRLVAAAWHGPCPEGKVCAHLDGTRDNNIPSNLKWVTPSENSLQQHEHGTMYTGAKQSGEDSPNSKLTNKEVFEIRRRFAGGEPGQQIHKDFSISIGAVRAVINRKTWRHI